MRQSKRDGRHVVASCSLCWSVHLSGFQLLLAYCSFFSRGGRAAIYLYRHGRRNTLGQHDASFGIQYAKGTAGCGEFNPVVGHCGTLWRNDLGEPHPSIDDACDSEGKYFIGWRGHPAGPLRAARGSKDHDYDFGNRTIQNAPWAHHSP